MRYGFTATRKGLTPKQKQVAMSLVERATEVRHGDCLGGDDFIHHIARIERATREGGEPLRIIIHPPTNDRLRAFCLGADETLPPKDYLVRNHDIVDTCEYLAAFPDGPERERSGTWATVRYARHVGRPFRIVMPDGLVVHQLGR